MDFFKIELSAHEIYAGKTGLITAAYCPAYGVCDIIIHSEYVRIENKLYLQGEYI